MISTTREIRDCYVGKASVIQTVRLSTVANSQPKALFEIFQSLGQACSAISIRDLKFAAPDDFWHDLKNRLHTYSGGEMLA